MGKLEDLQGEGGGGGGRGGRPGWEAARHGRRENTMVCFGSHMHLQPRLVKHRADSDAKIREAMQSVHQLQGGGGVEPARWLVEEDEGRVRHQLQPDVDTLALAAGEAAARGVADDCVPLRGGVAASSRE